ncbi:ubiquinone biosynthesis accessory factor UbiJ [Kaarinaea lacus]
MSPLSTALAAVLETAINQVLALDPETIERMSALQGKVIALELKGLNICLYLIPKAQGLNVFGHFEGKADTVLRGTPVAMARMGMASNAGDVLFAGDVEIDGDVELGQQFRDILDNLDIDWEEHLSHLTGDMVAHKLGNLVRGAVKWGKETANTLAMDAAEYFQEESQDLPNPGEVESFVKDVDTLRSDVDRLNVRVSRLQVRLLERLQERQQEGQGKPETATGKEVNS